MLSDAELRDGEIVDVVARTLCKQRGIDPDGFSGFLRFGESLSVMTNAQFVELEAQAIIEAHKAALTAAGYVIVPTATADQIAECNSRIDKIHKYIDERSESIGRGARRSTHRFKL